MINCNDIKDLFKLIGPNTTGMVEVIGVTFLADEPSIFGTVDEAYVLKEIEWYNSQNRNISGLAPNIPKLWKHTANEDGAVNSNYGWCIFSKENGHQFENVVKELAFNPESRRGSMIYTRPSMHIDACADGINDFICTNAVNYYITQDMVLVGVVQMRSNDVVYGYKNDRAWQQYVIDKLADRLKLTNTRLIWQVGSLHMYKNHVDKFLCI